MFVNTVYDSPELKKRKRFVWTCLDISLDFVSDNMTKRLPGTVTTDLLVKRAEVKIVRRRYAIKQSFTLDFFPEGVMYLVVMVKL